VCAKPALSYLDCGSCATWSRLPKDFPSEVSAS
jgi:hypothetical protein